MKIIIGWNGKDSRIIAELLKDWLKRVIQASNPVLVSSEEDSRDSYFYELIREESDCLGILCLTRQNHKDHGLLFDAGVLTNLLPENRLFGLLADLQKVEVSPPLRRLSLLNIDKGDMWELVRSINEGMRDRSLKSAVLEDSFQTFWDHFEKQAERFAVKEETSDESSEKTVSGRTYDSVIIEMLATVRALEKRLQIPSLERIKSAEISSGGQKPFQDSIVSLIRKMSSSSYSEEEIIEFLKKIGIPDSYTRYTVHKTLGNGVHMELHKKKF